MRTSIRGIEPGFYVYNSRRFSSALSAWLEGDCKRFDLLDAARALAAGRLSIDRVSCQAAAGEVAG